MASGTHAVRGALVVLIAVPFHTGLALPTLLTVLPVICRNPSALAEAVEEAVEVVLIAVPQTATQELEFQSLPFLAVLLALSVTGPRPAALPLGKRGCIRSDVAPRRIVVQHHVDHQVHIELFDVRLVGEPRGKARVGAA